MPERWASGPAASHHLLGRPELCMFFSASIAQEISSPKLAGSERGRCGSPLLLHHPSWPDTPSSFLRRSDTLALSSSLGKDP